MDLTVTLVEEGSKLRISDARPQEKVTDELIQAAFLGEGGISNWVTVRVTQGHTILDFEDDFGNRYVYILTEYHGESNTWTMRWPD